MTSRQKPGVAFWTTVVLTVMLVGYPLSFGPACWVTSRANAGAEWLSFFYRPIIAGLSTSDTRRSAAIKWYACLGAARGWYWVQDGIPLSDDNWIAAEWVWMAYPMVY